MRRPRALSLVALEALRRAVDGDGLERLPGGFWVPVNRPTLAVDEAIDRLMRHAPTWHASTGTVRGLEARGLLEGVGFRAVRRATAEGRELVARSYVDVAARVEHVRELLESEPGRAERKGPR